MPRQPAIYFATEEAAQEYPIKPLKGSRKHAQAFADRVTQSTFWRANCWPSWMGKSFDGSIPQKVLIEDDFSLEGAKTYLDQLYLRNWTYVPKIIIGHDVVYGNNKGISDKWIILHELAHVWTVEERGWHGKGFSLAYHMLVKNFIGRDAALVLKQKMKENKMRLPYSLILD